MNRVSVKNLIATVVALTVIVSVDGVAKDPVDYPQQIRIDVESSRDEAFVNALASVLPSMSNYLDVPGFNIAVARKGKVVFEGAYGFSDLHKGLPTRLDTVFRSGSMGKVYTGVAIMQLVEQGLLSLEDPINAHLPFAVENPLGGDEITIFHLMTHTSGLLTDTAGSVFSQPRQLEESLRAKFATDVIPMMGGGPTWGYKTGTTPAYSNIGIATLGLIVQEVNAQKLSYSDYVEQHIMQPLGMTSSQYPPVQSEEYVRPDIWSRMSTGYQHNGDMWIETPVVYFEEFPAGGFLATPADHVRLFMAMMSDGELNGERILQPESVDKMLSVSGPSSFPQYGAHHGLVWFLDNWDVAGERTFHHGGGHMWGWRTQGIAWPDHDTAVVYAVNEWSTTLYKDYYAFIDGVVGALLKAELPERPEAPLEDIDNLAWKASYLRGLLFAESYAWFVGVPQVVDGEVLDRVAAEASTVPYAGGSPLPWDPDAFVLGVHDLYAAGTSTDQIHQFAVEGDMRITLEEAQRIWAWIGSPGSMANLAGLLVSKQ